MTRNWMGWIFVAVLCSLTSAAQAQEKPAPTGSASQAAPPITSTAEGSIKTLDLKAPSPSLTVTTTYGSTSTFGLDPKTITVEKDGQTSKPEELKVGDRVKVSYMWKDGKRWAKSIELVQAPKSTTTPVASTATPATPASSPVERKQSY